MFQLSFSFSYVKLNSLTRTELYEPFWHQAPQQDFILSQLDMPLFKGPHKGHFSDEE